MAQRRNRPRGAGLTAFFFASALGTRRGKLNDDRRSFSRVRQSFRLILLFPPPLSSPSFSCLSNHDKLTNGERRAEDSAISRILRSRSENSSPPPLLSSEERDQCRYFIWRFGSLRRMIFGRRRGISNRNTRVSTSHNFVVVARPSPLPSSILSAYRVEHSCIPGRIFRRVRRALSGGRDLPRKIFSCK